MTALAGSLPAEHDIDATRCRFRRENSHHSSRYCFLVPAALPAGGLKLLVAVGVFLLLTAIMGWIGVKWNYNCCGRFTLGIYATVLIILMIMEFAAAGTILSFTSKLDDFGPSQAYRDFAVFRLVNQSYADCCCAHIRCPNDTCWLPANLLYPCDSISTFSQYLDEYISDRLVPIGVIAILIGLVQFFTSITACCNQCRGRQVQGQKAISGVGNVSYDGMYEQDEQYGGYGYDAYVKGGAAGGAPGAAPGGAGRPGPGGAPGATAPKAPGQGRGPSPASGAGGPGPKH